MDLTIHIHNAHSYSKVLSCQFKVYRILKIKTAFSKRSFSKSPMICLLTSLINCDKIYHKTKEMIRDNDTYNVCIHGKD